MSEPPFIHYDENLPAGRFRFLHVEKISTRARRYNWELLPHRHRDLYQIALIETGSGEVNFDLRVQEFHGRTLILIPPLVIHSFTYASKASGDILTISQDFVRELNQFVGETSLIERLANPAVLSLADAPDDFARLRGGLHAIYENVQSGRRSSSAILSASTLSVLAIATDHIKDVAPSSPETQRRRHLYANYRELLEQYFLQQLPMAGYAEMMAITERTLHRVCREIAGESPLKIAHRRTVLEAQRLLLYSGLTISEVAYHLGFRDPSGFSRFFVDNVGEPPQVFRRTRLG